MQSLASVFAALLLNGLAVRVLALHYAVSDRLGSSSTQYCSVSCPLLPPKIRWHSHSTAGGFVTTKARSRTMSTRPSRLPLFRQPVLLFFLRNKLRDQALPTFFPTKDMMRYLRCCQTQSLYQPVADQPDSLGILLRFCANRRRSRRAAGPRRPLCASCISTIHLGAVSLLPQSTNRGRCAKANTR